MSIGIENRRVGGDAPPLIVAELSGNHNGSLERALTLVDMAAAAGAHAVKLQTYTAATMTLNLNRDEFRINAPGHVWHGRTLYGLYEEAHTPWSWHAPLFERARRHGLLAFSRPIAKTAATICRGCKPRPKSCPVSGTHCCGPNTGDCAMRR